MDITIKTKEGILNYRVAAVIIYNGCILAQYNEAENNYYLPGGRVHMNETSEEAIKREMKEELKFDVADLKPLWLDENFFTENGERYHELCIYFQIDISDTGFSEYKCKFSIAEGSRINYFQWLPFDELKNITIYPLFIKEKIYNLPNGFTMTVSRD